MEAKDTVTSSCKLCSSAENQAEISFKAGVVQGKMDYLLGQGRIVIEAKEASKQEGIKESDKKWRQILKDSIVLAKLSGIKEVVEWAKDHYWDSLENNKDIIILHLEAKLKEWGIEEK